MVELGKGWWEIERGKDTRGKPEVKRVRKSIRDTSFWTPKEFAAIMKVSHLTVLEWIRDGRLEAEKLPQGYRISVEQADRFLENQGKKKA